MEEAAKLFPELRWYAQQRPMFRGVQLYQQFTAPFELITDEGGLLVLPGHEFLFMV